MKRWAKANKADIYRDKCRVIYSINIMEGTWVSGPLLVPGDGEELIFELCCQETEEFFKGEGGIKHSRKKE